MDVRGCVYDLNVFACCFLVSPVLKDHFREASG